ncbi:urease accessory protein UreH domain-containing protein [Actinomadura hibisca]|uniref:urease accessory protein UreH domain-containing protein n=1 Tax=Actinomadura hibisca TaxID=68565 RepID=UPI000829696B|nr:sulfite exporter TauE/SafE family protein [Actinomadura hibisca]
MDTAALFLSGAGAGLLAGGTTCAAVQLGLLTGAVRGAHRASGPVTAFLTAKLVTHAALGALLGLAGGVVQPGPQARGALLGAAAAVLALFALDLLGFGPARRLLGRGRSPARHAGTAAGTSEKADKDKEAGDGLARQAAGTLDEANVAVDGGPDGHCAAETERVRRPVTPGEADVAVDGGLGDHCAAGAARFRRPSASGAARFRRPAVLGAATVLVPCGLTLSAELLAVASRSPVGGAAVMAGFVLGTVPLFGLLGVTLGRTMALLRGRLTALLGVGLLAVAAWTLVSGLRLGGWLPDGGGARAAADAGRFVTTDAAGTQVVTVWALDRGYRPALVDARAGVRTVLVLRTQGTRGHTRGFTVPGRGLDVILPVTGETRIDLGTPGPGRMRFVCASGHYPGAITFR